MHPGPRTADMAVVTILGLQYLLRQHLLGTWEAEVIAIATLRLRNQHGSAPTGWRMVEALRSAQGASRALFNGLKAAAGRTSLS